MTLIKNLGRHTSSHRRRRRRSWVPRPLDLAVRGVVRIASSVVWRVSHRRIVEWVMAWGEVRGGEGEGEKVAATAPRGEWEETASGRRPSLLT
jgi:hypothetical protein